MSDAWQDLPLSRRRGDDDESGVSNDWRLRTVDALRAFAAMLDPLSPAEWKAPSLRPASPRYPAERLTVADLVARLVAEIDATPLDRLLRRTAAADLDDAPHVLRARADALAGRRDHVSIRPLLLTVTAAADASISLGIADRIAAASSGSVALALAAAAPAPIRGVLLGRSVVPDDAAWSLARGPAIRGSSALLIAWLGGRDVVPRFD